MNKGCSCHSCLAQLRTSLLLFSSLYGNLSQKSKEIKKDNRKKILIGKKGWEGYHIIQLKEKEIQDKIGEEEKKYQEARKTKQNNVKRQR